ncbi:hypothetical protein V3C99_012008, partial [Haemonchus contortus]
IEYYKCKKEIEECSDSESDSAIHSPRVWSTPPISKARDNGVRSSTRTYMVPRKAMSLSNLHKVELLRYRACGEQYILNKDQLVFHLISFINVCEDGPRAYDDQPLFIICNDTMGINRNFINSDRFRPFNSEKHLANIAKPYSSTHMALYELALFIDKLRANRSLPAFWEVFLDFIRDFFADYRNSLSKLHNFKKLTVAGLLTSTAPFRESIQLLHSLTCSWLEVHKFEWIHVEMAWNNLFAIMEDSNVLSESEIAIVIRLQKIYQRALLRVMDSVYSFGRVPKNWEQHFILYNDASDVDLLTTRTDKSVESLLWNDNLLQIVLRGARARVRLGPKNDIAPVFSEVFYDYMEQHDLPPERFITFHQFQHAFESAAAKLTHSLSKELLMNICAAGLLEHWIDLKEITCGRVAHCFAAFVYGSNSDSVMIGTLDTEELYRTALLRGGVPPSRAAKWRLKQGALSETAHCIQCDLERPLSYAFRYSLIPIINGCMDNMFKIFRVVELLTSVSSDRKTAEDFKKVDGHRRAAEMRVRYMSFIVSKLLNLVCIVKDLFVEKVISIFDRHAKILNAAVEVEEIEKTLTEAESELHALVVRTDIRKAFHEIIDILKELAGEIRLKSVSNDLTMESLIRWHKTTVRSIEFLTLVGKAMPIDSVFHALYVRLKYNRDNVRYPVATSD